MTAKLKQQTIKFIRALLKNSELQGGFSNQEFKADIP